MCCMHTATGRDAAASGREGLTCAREPPMRSPSVWNPCVPPVCEEGKFGRRPISRPTRGAQRGHAKVRLCESTQAPALGWLCVRGSCRAKLQATARRCASSGIAMLGRVLPDGRGSLPECVIAGWRRDRGPRARQCAQSLTRMTPALPAEGVTARHLPVRARALRQYPSVCVASARDACAHNMCLAPGKAGRPASALVSAIRPTWYVCSVL